MTPQVPSPKEIRAAAQAAADAAQSVASTAMRLPPASIQLAAEMPDKLYVGTTDRRRGSSFCGLRPGLELDGRRPQRQQRDYSDDPEAKLFAMHGDPPRGHQERKHQRHRDLTWKRRRWIVATLCLNDTRDDCEIGESHKRKV